jgi:phytoene desaturase
MSRGHVKPTTAVVIGGGISGLAAANLLARDGWQVTVLEQGSTLGGRAGQLIQDGFTFDTGPSWYLMPDVFEHYFGLFDRRVDEFFTLTRLDPAYRVFTPQASPVTIHADLAQDAATFEALEPGAGRKLNNHVARATKLYHVSKRHFLYIDRLRPQSFVSPDVLGALSAMPKTASLNSYVEHHFKHPVLRQILQYYSVFLGVSPYKAPSIYALMSHLDFNQGVFYPSGGIYSVIQALISLGRELGVDYQLSTQVTQILTTSGRATGVKLANGKTIAASIVISSADLHHTEQNLLTPSARSLPDSFWEKAEPSPSALLLYLGVKGRLPQLAHHNLIFTEDWHQNFSDIFEHDTWPHPASMYVSAPSVTDSSVAPPDHENLFVLIPLPASKILPTPAEQTAAADRYIEQLARAIGAPDLKQRLVVRKEFGPAEFSNRFHAWRANALGLGHTWGQSAWWRPGVASSKVAGLYSVGGNVRPGIGLPMCLISAQLVIKNLHADSSDGPLKRYPPRSSSTVKAS